jgi:hypothetical protein
VAEGWDDGEEVGDAAGRENYDNCDSDDRYLQGRVPFGLQLRLSD